MICTIVYWNRAQGRVFFEPGLSGGAHRGQSARMARYDAILFDKDGTLYDFQSTYGGWAAGMVHELAGGDAVLAEVLAAELKLDRATSRFEPDSVAIAGTTAEMTEALAPHLPIPPGEIHARIDASAHGVPLAEAVPLSVFLADLRGRGLGLGVVTNDTESAAREHLRRTGILDDFGFVAGFDSGHGAKPSPGPVLAGARALGAAPERTVMVGDSTHDLVAGRAAGMTTVAVLTGVAPADELHPFADVIFPDIGHIPGWLDGL